MAIRKNRMGGGASAADGKAKVAQSPYSAIHSGPGRVLTAVYGVFALSATARAGYQFYRDFQHAPLAYSLSLFAAVVYVVAIVCLVIGNKVTHHIAVAAVSVELVGVLAVGLLSVLHPELFPEATVWSTFGIGYGFVPLVLPFVGLFWLLRVGRRARAAAE